jgi:aspartate/tyrosine/aromatic aminotransferase
MAEEVIFKNKSGHEYLPFKGLADFTKRTAEFAFGANNQHLKDNRVRTLLQTFFSQLISSPSSMS